MLKTHAGETIPSGSRGVTLALLALTILSTSLVAIQLAHAPGEVYTLTLSSSRVQESNVPGVTLYLNVTKANPASNYQFTFSVTDPSGSRANATTSIFSGQATFLASLVYPSDFGAGVIMRYVGNYAINVAQTQPGNKPTVATDRFLVGLTDNVSYQRTYQVFTKAAGYAAYENITIRLLQGTALVQGFPQFRLADVNGSLSFPWQILPDAATGTYNITLTGLTTKNPADTQTFTVYPTIVTIPGLTVNSATIDRTLTQQFLFSPQYPSGQRVQTGQATVRISEPGGVTYAYTNGNYDSLTGTFRATYRLPSDAVAGIWVATIDTYQFDDGFGNRGPTLTAVTGFDVQPAPLTVSITTVPPIGKIFGAGDAIPIYASIKYPDGTLVDSGVVTETLSQSGPPVKLIGTPLNLTYISGQQEWAGSYQVKYSDPSGIWVVTVDVSDKHGNFGEETVSAIVSIPPSTPPASQPSGLNTSSFLLIAAIVAAAALGVLVLALLVHRKKVTRSVVKLDLRMVDNAVDKIQEGAFFQRVKKQVEDTKGAQSDEPTREAMEGGGDSPH